MGSRGKPGMTSSFVSVGVITLIDATSLALNKPSSPAMRSKKGIQGACPLAGFGAEPQGLAFTSLYVRPLSLQRCLGRFSGLLEIAVQKVV